MWLNYKVTQSSFSQNIIPFIRNVITLSYLDSSFESDVWEMESILLASNTYLEDQYRSKKKEMEKQGNVSEEVLFSFSQSNDVVPAVLTNGLRSHTISSDFLGDRMKGVTLFKHADLLLKVAKNMDHPNAKLSLFVCITARSKVVGGLLHNNALRFSNILEDADCCVSCVTPRLTDNLDSQIDNSQVYIFDQCESNFSERPRQCKPVACVVYRSKQPLRPSTVSLIHFQCYASSRQESNTNLCPNVSMSSTGVIPISEPGSLNEEEDRALTARFIQQLANIKSYPLSVQLRADAINSAIHNMYSVSATVPANWPSVDPASIVPIRSGLDSTATKWPESAGPSVHQQLSADLRHQIPQSFDATRSRLGNLPEKSSSRTSRRPVKNISRSRPRSSTSRPIHAAGFAREIHGQSVPPDTMNDDRRSYPQSMIQANISTAELSGLQISGLQPPCSTVQTGSFINYDGGRRNERGGGRGVIPVQPQHISDFMPAVTYSSTPFDQYSYPGYAFCSRIATSLFPEHPVPCQQPPFICAPTNSNFGFVSPELRGYNGAGKRQNLGNWPEAPRQTRPLSHLSPQVGNSSGALPHCTSLSSFDVAEPLSVTQTDTIATLPTWRPWRDQPPQLTACSSRSGMITTTSNCTSPSLSSRTSSAGSTVNDSDAGKLLTGNTVSCVPRPGAEFQVDRRSREIVFFDTDQSDVSLGGGCNMERGMEHDSLSWMRLDEALADLVLCSEQRVSNTVPITPLLESQANAANQTLKYLNSNEVGSATGGERLVKREPCEIEFGSKDFRGSETRPKYLACGPVALDDDVSNSTPMSSSGRTDDADVVHMPTNNACMSVSVNTSLPSSSLDPSDTLQMKQSSTSQPSCDFDGSTLSSRATPSTVSTATFQSFAGVRSITDVAAKLVSGLQSATIRNRVLAAEQRVGSKKNNVTISSSNEKVLGKPSVESSCRQNMPTCRSTSAVHQSDPVLDQNGSEIDTNCKEALNGDTHGDTTVRNAPAVDANSVCETVVYKINEDKSVELRLEEQRIFKYRSNIPGDSKTRGDVHQLQAVLELNCDDVESSAELVDNLAKLFGLFKVVDVNNRSCKLYELHDGKAVECVMCDETNGRD